MRDAVEKIHRAIERIDDPLIIARLVADDSFFAIKRVFRKTFEQHLRDQILGLNIDLEFDVVRSRGVDRERLLKMRAEQIAGRAGRFFRGLEIMCHRGYVASCNLTDSARAAAKIFSATKKPGGENEFSSRVEVNMMEERFCHRPSVDIRL